MATKQGRATQEGEVGRRKVVGVGLAVGAPMGLRGKMEAQGVGRRSPPSLLRTSPSFLELEAIAAVAVEEVEFLSMALDHVENTRVRVRAMEVEEKDVRTAPAEMDCRVP